MQVQETDADMTRALFCVCAPGATQDTTRFFRAILKGCIPVTFFRCPAPCPDLCPILLTILCDACLVPAACLPVLPAEDSLQHLCCIKRPRINKSVAHQEGMILPAGNPNGLVQTRWRLLCIASENAL